MRKLLWIGMSLALLITSCGSKTEKSNGPATESAAVSAIQTGSTDEGPGTALPPGEQKIIQQGTLRLQVDSLSSARNYLSTVLQKYKAYIANENENRQSGNHESTLVIRVPGQFMEALITDISSKAKFIDTKDLSSEDIGMEYMDIEARLKAKLEMEKRYLQLLQRTGKISEMLEVEQQLGIVRGEIESMQGKLKYFDNRVAYATLTISLYEVVPINESPGLTFLSRAAYSFSNGLQLIQEVVLLAINIWPLFLIVGIVFTILLVQKEKGRITLHRR
ncbi:MAG: DUF4349 domain-containing protein [Bacteroidetes bacterium]|nr:DUF4349 domain-containing protein [Bacteroidota bacterium]